MNDTSTNTITSARRYVVTTDGACRGNPGPGGWGAILVSFDGDVIRGSKALSGWKSHATNNQMELTAALKALSWLPVNGVPALLRSDSRYVVDGMTAWRDGWIANNWRTADGKQVKNRALWQALIAAVGERQVSWEWVRGHSGDADNEMADRLARRAIENIPGRERH